MIQKITSIFLVSILLFASSCASIVSKSNYPITINSTPSNAKITVTDKKGNEVYTGGTPATVSLKAGDGYFSKASYQVKFEKEGYNTTTAPVEFKLDGWYIGNILFGGVIGLLIVDPITGAMYKLDTEFLYETLTQSTANVEQEELKVYTLNEIPEDWKEHLVEME